MRTDSFLGFLTKQIVIIVCRCPRGSEIGKQALIKPVSVTEIVTDGLILYFTSSRAATVQKQYSIFCAPLLTYFSFSSVYDLISSVFFNGGK